MATSRQLSTRPVGSLTLRISLWLVQHRLRLKRICTAALGVFCVGLYAYMFWVVVGLARGQTADREMMAAFTQDLIDYPSLRPLVSPHPLQSGLPLALTASDGLVDMAAQVANPNQKFAVMALEYRFSDERGEFAAGTTFLLPGEIKYVFSFGQRHPVGALQFVVTNVTWQRVRPDGFAQLREAKLRALITDVQHRRPAELGLVGSRLGGQTTFTVRNDSIFGYWDVALYVLLRNGDRLEAAHFTRIRQIGAGQAVPVTINWTQALPPVTEVTVVPEINPFDARAFYDYRATENTVPR